MAMPDMVERYWTAEDVGQLPDDRNRYECIDGALLVTPAPSFDHAYLVEGFGRALDAYAKALRPGMRLYQAPVDVEIRPGSLVRPDLCVARPKAGVGIIRGPADLEGLVLAIEVLSPSTARIDRGRKREFYQRAGVEEYWIVDPQSRLVERWRPADTRPEIVRDSLTWHPAGVATPLEIELPALFREALGE